MRKAIAIELENRVQEALDSKTQTSLHPSQRGRCQTLHTSKIPLYTKPIKPSRHGALQPNYNGHNLQHQRWFTQLRRLESLSKLLLKQQHWNTTQMIHANREWRAVHAAPGFEGGFQTWWNRIHPKYQDSPESLPFQLPTLPQLGGIILTLTREVRAFEKVLSAELQLKAKNSRAQNPNKVFKDFAKPAVHPVQILDNSICATVVQVDDASSSLILDKPCDFNPGPITGPNGPITPIMTCHDTVWVEPADLVPTGSLLSQTDHVGDIDDLFSNFAQEWVKRWDKHRDLPSDFWDPMNSFVETAIPQHEPMQLPPITHDVWHAALKKKRSRAAPGPDGLTRDDLLNFPKDVTEQMLKFLAQIESGQKKWPTQWTTGIVHCLEKSDRSPKASDYRPITIFSLVFRTWSSIRSSQVLRHLQSIVPIGCCGNIPARSAADIWYAMQTEIEDAFDHDRPLCGMVCDIQKCFNNLPREPLLKILHRLGVVPPILRAWCNALTTITRRFAIRGSVGPSHKSTTGFAEGDSLSVVSMVGTNYLLDKYLALKAPSVRMWSYVDNLELTAPDIPNLLAGFESMEHLLTALQIPLDTQKTYGWGTTPQTRKEIVEAQYLLQHSCRDLGGHMQYTKKATNQTITKRIADFKPRWKSLAISPASYQQKLMAARAVAWSQTLHGIASTVIDPAHFDTLRTEALRALGEHKPGASPAIHFALVEHPTFDPAFQAILITVRMARQHMHPDRIVPMLTTANQMPRRRRARVGPCHVLLHNVRLLGWEWDPAGYFRTFEQVPIDLWHSPIQHLLQSLYRDWQRMIAFDNSARKSMQGLHLARADFTMENMTKDQMDRALLRKALNGTFLTANHLKHRDEDEDGACKLCFQPDSITHRLWECEAFAPIRQALPAEDLQELRAMTPATYNHGWMELPHSFDLFWDAFAQLNPDPLVEVCPCPEAATCLHFFTDGACINPKDKFARLCSWGVVLTTNVDPWDFHPVACNLLLGPLQTIVRAELTAVVYALRLAFRYSLPFWIWVDNQLVYRQLRYMIQHPYTEWSRKTCNHDLLNSIAVYLGHVQYLCKSIQKICSHQDLALADDPAELWSFHGNNAADSTASHAFDNFPSLMRSWETMCTDLARRRQCRQTCHALIVAIAKDSMQKHQQATQIEPQPLPLILSLNGSTVCTVMMEMYRDGHGGSCT